LLKLTKQPKHITPLKIHKCMRCATCSLTNSQHCHCCYWFDVVFVREHLTLSAFMSTLPQVVPALLRAALTHPCACVCLLLWCAISCTCHLVLPAEDKLYKVFSASSFRRCRKLPCVSITQFADTSTTYWPICAGRIFRSESVVGVYIAISTTKSNVCH
jgi:hypothetical protein